MKLKGAISVEILRIESLHEMRDTLREKGKKKWHEIAAVIKPRELDT